MQSAFSNAILNSELGVILTKFKSLVDLSLEKMYGQACMTKTSQRF